jgi:SAM-dependent methyltransferase
MKVDFLGDFPTFDKLSGNLSHELLKGFATYYEESRFGLELLIDDLIELNDHTRILEIGSGIGLLSRYLASKGFQVTSIDPAGEGFGMMTRLQEHVGKHFDSKESSFQFYNSTIEDFNPSAQYDYIFSINVFEHIEDPLHGLRKIDSLLGIDGLARIITPNYGIPYEPHFHIPIFFSKKFTYLIFRSRIRFFNCFDPIGLWKSLNWVSICKVNRMLIQESIPGIFSLNASNLYFKRLSRDDQFLVRKGAGFKFVALRLKFLLNFLPLWLYPVLDLRIAKSRQLIHRTGE